MAWNTTHTRFYSTDLASLECGNNIRIPRRDREITKSAIYDGDLEVGQCVAMLRVPKDARILDATLDWQNGGSTIAVFAVGDPYACGRLLGPVSTQLNSGAFVAANGGYWNCAPWGTCGTLTKTGRNGDGCGRWYQYTCETDILVTNLYHAAQAANGGFLGGSIGALLAGQPSSAKWTGGRLVLTVKYLDAS